MKTYLLLFTIIGMVFISCDKETKCDISENQFDYLKISHENEAVLNFALTDSLFLTDIELKTKTDLCDNSQFIGVITYDNCLAKLPVMIDKDCGIYYLTKTGIIYDVLKSDLTLIDSELPNIESKSDFVFNKIKEYHITHNRKRFPIHFIWNDKLDEKINQEGLLNVFKAIDKYYNSLSQSSYNKPIQECSKKEITEIKKNLNMVVILEENYNYPPPPPPMPKETNSN